MWLIWQLATQKQQPLTWSINTSTEWKRIPPALQLATTRNCPFYFWFHLNCGFYHCQLLCVCWGSDPGWLEPVDDRRHKGRRPGEPTLHGLRRQSFSRLPVICTCGHSCRCLWHRNADHPFHCTTKTDYVQYIISFVDINTDFCMLSITFM